MRCGFIQISSNELSSEIHLLFCIVLLRECVILKLKSEVIFTLICELMVVVCEVYHL